LVIGSPRTLEIPHLLRQIVNQTGVMDNRIIVLAFDAGALLKYRQMMPF